MNLQKPREIDRLFALLEKHRVIGRGFRGASTSLFLYYFAEVNLREMLSTLASVRMLLV